MGRYSVRRFAFSASRQVFHHHEHLFGTARQIHCAADRGNRVRLARMPIRQIATDRHLEAPSTHTSRRPPRIIPNESA